MNSINVYAEESNEQPVADELGDIIELGFQKQRDLRSIERTTDRRGVQSTLREAKQEDKELIESLLGEDGAEDFNTICTKKDSARVAKVNRPKSFVS